MAKISPSILSLEFFCKNSVYLHVRLRERFVIPQLLKQLAVYKIKEECFKGNIIRPKGSSRHTKAVQNSSKSNSPTPLTLQTKVLLR